MKRAQLILLSALILALSINLTLAVEIQLTKDSYYPGETLQAEISGNFIDVLRLENIGIYREDLVHKTPAEAGLIKSDNKYLYYAVLPETAGNYSIKIENIRYYQDSTQTSQPIIKDFTIVQTNASYLSFTPGAIAATGDFSVKIKAYNKEQQVNVEFSATGQKESFNLGQGNERTVYFSIAGIKSFTKSNIKINSYALQAIITPPLPPTPENLTINITELNLSLSDLVDVSPNEINLTILPDLEYYFNIFVYNKVTQAIRGINLSSSHEEINISPSKIEEIKAVSNYTLNLTIKSDEDIDDGLVSLIYQDSVIEIPIRIAIAENETEVSYTTPSLTENKTCAEAGGVKCDIEKNEECTGVQTYASDGLCCMAECAVKKASTAWIWGIVILLILAVGGYFLYKRQKRVPGAEKPKEILGKRVEEYKERMMPEAQEVEKKLVKT